MSATLNDEKVKEYKETFEMFDRDKNGLINDKELGNILRALGHEPSDNDIIEMMDDVDHDNNGLIDFNEFMLIMQRRAKDADIESELIEAFRVFDKEDDGRLSTSEFKNIMLTLGERLSEEEIEEMIKEADSRNEGFIYYKEFAKLLLSK